MGADLPERSKKLTRQLSRHLKSETAEFSILQLADFLETGPAGAPDGLSPDGLRGFSALLSSIDKSYEEYEDKVRFTTRSLEISSNELNASNEELEKLNAGINAMLDSLGQGLIFFNHEGICYPNFSEACLTLLETDPANKSIMDVLKLGEREREDFQNWLSIVFQGSTALSFDDLKSLAPTELTNVKKQYISLDYRPIYLHDNDLAGILLIATDKTLERDAARKIQNTRDEARKIENIARRRNEFWRYIYNLKAFMVETRSRDLLKMDRNTLMRDLHTYKGLSQLFGLSELAGFLHKAESAADMLDGSPEQTAKLEEWLKEITAEMEKALELGMDLFGPSFSNEGQVRILEYRRLEDLRDMIMALPMNGSEQRKLVEFFNSEILATPVKSCFEVFASELMRLCEGQGKSRPEFIYINGDTKIIFNEYEAFFDSLVHLARNIADHGIEMPSQRREKNKGDAGIVTIETHQVQDGPNKFYRFVISDDGRGFNVDHLRSKLKSMNRKDAATMPDYDVIQCIFDPNLSTAEATTSLSGRGVGMNAILTEVKNLGGTASAEQAPNGGARFVLTVPNRI